jgi:hypothetical protein
MALSKIIIPTGPMFEQTFKNIDDVLWKEAGCSSELDYTEQTSWMLFLKYLDDLEREHAMGAELEGKPYTAIIDEVQTFAGRSSLSVTMDRCGHLFMPDDSTPAMDAIAWKLMGHV